MTAGIANWLSRGSDAASPDVAGDRMLSPRGLRAASSISFTDDVVMSSPRRGRYLRCRRNIFYFLFRCLRLKMTALYKSGDTIYQRTVKLNVNGLTEPHAAPQRCADRAEDVTRAP